VEIDEWILDFAALFREHLGIDAEAHLDLHAEVRSFLFGFLCFWFLLVFFTPNQTRRRRTFSLHSTTNTDPPLSPLHRGDDDKLYYYS
jgi:hypothetical protein